MVCCLHVLSVVEGVPLADFTIKHYICDSHTERPAGMRTLVTTCRNPLVSCTNFAVPVSVLNSDFNHHKNRWDVGEHCFAFCDFCTCLLKVK